MPLIDQGVISNGINPVSALRGIGQTIPSANWIRLRQPYLDSHGRACVTVNDLKGGITRNDSHGGEPKPLLRNYLVNELRNMGFNLPMVCNAATLRKGDWIELDRTIHKVHRQRLRLVSDIESASVYGGFNGMAKMTIEYQAVSEAGEAVVDMDGHTDGRTDVPLNNLRSLPLPITHSDFGFSSREIAVSGNSGMSFDVVMGEQASRRVTEMLEDQAIGNVTGQTYGTQTAGFSPHTGTSTVYGLRTFPSRLTKTNFTIPTTTNGPTTYAEILAALSQLYAQNVYGPFVIYHSTDWSPFMDSPFSTAGGNHPSETLRTMLMKIPDVSDVRRLDRLTTTFTLFFVQMTSETIQMVNGMGITTIQWEEKGGLDLRWKVMCIKVPRFFVDYNLQTGVLHGTTA